jgi:hypothetical protein
MITFVSSFYQIKSKFPIETYIQWASNFINETMNFNLVLYSDKNSYLYIEYLFKNNSKVKVIVKELEEFNLYSLKDKWIENHSKNYLLNHTSWELNMLWNEKVFMVYDTMKENPFNTQWFGWCDIGYFRDGSVGTKEFPWPNHNKVKSLHHSKIYYGLVEEKWIDKIKESVESKNETGLPSIQIPENQVSIAGGFFISHFSNVKWYKELIEKTIYLYFENNYLIKDDQIIVSDLIFSNLQRFELIKGDWFLFRDYLMKTPTVSILIPIYNGIEYIKESINSVLSQTYKDWEIIIGINGHSKDSEVYNIAKIYECENVKVYELDTKGKSDSLNKMLEYCSGSWIALLDVDDIWMPYKLEHQIQYIKEYDVVGTKCVYFGDKEGIIPKIPKGDLSNFDFKSVNPIINSSCLLKKELCFWNQEYDGIEDYELWFRLKSQQKKFYNLEEVLVKHRIHDTSSFNTKNFDIEGLKNKY